ncbi:MAG: TMEM175 family protein [Rhodoluna sp.]|nr:TMEM175 family protein [Rhodoluna sp.]
MTNRKVDMKTKFLDLEHSRIDALSDGIYAIALTLLGFDLIGSVKAASEAENLVAGLAEQWPVYFSFFLGFFVLYATWYQYHVRSQFAGRPTALIVWQHGFGLMIASLIPFGAAILAENINTANMGWAVLCFGVIIFAESPLQLVFFTVLHIRGAMPVSNDSPFTPASYVRMGAYLAAFSTLYGSFAIAIAFASPWLALMLYGIFLMSKVNPVGTFNRLIPRLNGILKLGIETN